MRGGGRKLFLILIDFLFRYSLETNLYFYYIPEKSRLFQNPPNIWDGALCDISKRLSALV